MQLLFLPNLKNGSSMICMAQMKKESKMYTVVKVIHIIIILEDSKVNDEKNVIWKLSSQLMHPRWTIETFTSLQLTSLLRNYSICSLVLVFRNKSIICDDQVVGG